MFNTSLITSDKLREAYIQTQNDRSVRVKKRLKKPVIVLCDGDWDFLVRVDQWVIESNFQWKYNEKGTCRIVLPVEGNAGIERMARILLDPKCPERSGANNIHIRCDKDGARWTGTATMIRLGEDSNGARVIIIEGVDDWDELEGYLCWPNPFLPDALQFPRVFMLVGRTAWILKMTLLANLIRVQGSLWKLPDDPLDLRSWGETFNPSQWPIAVKPGAAFQDISPINVVSARMEPWTDVAAPLLADAQLMVKMRRWFAGDKQPWPGYNPRNGQLIVDVVDKSGWWNPDGTSVIGNLWNGFIRQVQALSGNNIDTESTIVDAPTVVPEYRKKGWLGTVPSSPYVTYRDSDVTGVDSVELTWQPSTAVQIVAGGNSMYGVNEGITASIQAAGNALGTFIAVPTAGEIASTFLTPILSDTVAAWLAMKSHNRANAIGWSRRQEKYAEGSSNAISLSSFVAIRRALWESRERYTHVMSVADGAPWFIGDEGQGHFWLGDRVGSTVKQLPYGKMIVEQVTELNLVTSRSDFGWKITMGDFTATESETDTFIRSVSRLTGGLNKQGVL